jgi:hypothetical protein
MFLVAPELHKHVQKKAAHRDQTCKNDDRHEILSFGALVGGPIASLRGSP